MKCQGCGDEFATDPAKFNNWCPDCRKCPDPECGSEFLIRHTVPGFTEVRCMTCLHHERKPSTAIKGTP